MSKQRSIISVKEATRQAFELMPDEFNGFQLVAQTKKLLGNPHVFDSNITRRLRDLRKDNPQNYGYLVTDIPTSKYKKLKLVTANTLE